MSKNKEFKLPQIAKFIYPGDERDDKGDYTEKKLWIDWILNFTKRTEAGKWNEKYGVMVFKANYGYHSAMKKIVEDYVKQTKKENPDVIVMEEVDDNKVRSWVIGNSDKIKEMVEDELNDKRRSNTKN